MKTFTTTDLQKNAGNVLFAANKEPIALTRHGKERYVLMTVKDYERCIARDTRRSYMASEALPEHIAMVEQALIEGKGKPAMNKVSRIKRFIFWLWYP